MAIKTEIENLAAIASSLDNCQQELQSTAGTIVKDNDTRLCIQHTQGNVPLSNVTLHLSQDVHRVQGVGLISQVHTSAENT